MPIDPKILSVQPGADRANAGEADPRSMLSFDLATPDTAPDEWQRAAARRISANLGQREDGSPIGVDDPDGRVWKGKPFATGAEYLSFMRGMLKSGDVWEYAATEELKAFEAADDAGRAAIARAALGMADRAIEAVGRAVPGGYGFKPGAPELKDAPEEVLAANARLRPTGGAAQVQSGADGQFGAVPRASREGGGGRRQKGARRLAQHAGGSGVSQRAPREAAAGQPLGRVALGHAVAFRPRPGDRDRPFPGRHDPRRGRRGLPAPG